VSGKENESGKEMMIKSEEIMIMKRNECKGKPIGMITRAKRRMITT
jgi:hypothetical protein